MSAAVFGRRTAAQALGLLFLGGSAVGLLILLLPHDAGVDEGPLYAIAAVTTALGLLMLTRADRVGPVQIHACVALGTLLVAAGNLSVGTTSLYPMIYTWMVLFAFTFFGRRAAFAHLALAGTSYAVVLLLQDDPSSPVARWALVMATPLVGGLLVSRVLDLARQRTHVAQEGERRTQAIVEGAPDAFVSMELDGTVLAWNRGAERMFYIPQVEALGRNGAELMFPAEDDEAHSERTAAHLDAPEDEKPVRRELELMRRDGSPFPAEAVISRVVSGGRPLLVAFIRDMTDAAHRERERAQLIRAQAARDEAEQVAATVHGLQLLLDAALTQVHLDDMLESLVPKLCEVLSADTAAIFLVDDEDGVLTLRASTAGIDPDAPPLRARPGEGLAGQVAERRRPELFQGSETDQALDPDVRAADSVLCVPLLARGKVTGVVEVGVVAPRQFSEDDLAILGLAADRVGLALEHARIYEREHRIAETLQRSLLPDRLPELPGFAAAARYLPAASEAEVGGDWYDVIQVEPGRVALVMGDVAGKGLAAAALVGRLRSAIRAYALEGHEPRTVVEGLNRVMWSESEDAEMATLVYAVVDSTACTISWVNAGHLPPLVIEADCKPRFLERPPAVPLGVMPNALYEPVERELSPGTCVLLYTDGLVERPGESIDDGLERLCDTALEIGRGVDRLCQELIGRLVPGGSTTDDVALLAVRTEGLSDHFRIELSPQPGRLTAMRSFLDRWLRHVGGSEEESVEIAAAAGTAAGDAIEHAIAVARPLEVAGRLLDGEVEIAIGVKGSGEGTTARMRLEAAARPPAAQQRSA